MLKTKILIVDDHQENITALSHLIASDEIEILSAQNAQDALDLLIKHDFALALLDVNMPLTSGFELARLLRGVKKFKHLPIIFVTASQKDQSVIFEGYESGAVDLLFKPLDPHVVRSKVKVFVDLDQQKKIVTAQVEELERLKKEAEAANIAKSQFLANMSHEIRTPLAAVLGFTDILTQPDVTEKEKTEYMAAIQRNGQLLLRVIDDILDLSKIEAQKLRLESTEVHFDEIIQDVQQSLAHKAIEQKTILHLDIKPLPTKCLSDPIRIKQILLNIIGNAIKFTKQGQVYVKAWSEAIDCESKKQYKIMFEVSDTGVGLTADQIEKLFKPFSQADSSTRRNFGGTGLGLVISKQLAQAMGGDIKLVKSEPESGSIFQISLLLEQNETSDKEKLRCANVSQDISTTNPMCEKKKVLVVDDSVDNRLLVELFLKKLDLSLEFAQNGKAAVEAVKQMPFDLILMDIQMPIMDGCEATEQIRKLGYKTPIIALTAHAMKEEHDRYKAYGCNHVITKPINRQDLIHTSAKYLNLH